MFKHILVPLDGTDTGERALAAAQVLAQVGNSSITLLHAVSILNPAYSVLPYPLSMEVYGDMVNVETHKVEAYLKSVEERLHNCGLNQVNIKVLDGEAGAVINEVAAKDDVDLIVMGTHGRTGIARTVLGSVADSVIRKGNVPVLLVSPQQSTGSPSCGLGIRRILVPLDGSPLSQQALTIAGVLAQAEDAEVVLLNVLPQAVLTGEELDTPNPQSARRTFNQVANQMLPPQVEYSVVITSEVAAEAIVREAVERECDLIVMTTHGRSGFDRMRFGSVADKVLAHTAVPLLLLHAQTEAPATAD